MIFGEGLDQMDIFMILLSEMQCIINQDNNIISEMQCMINLENKTDMVLLSKIQNMMNLDNELI